MNYQAPKIEWIDQNKLDENKVETENWHQSIAETLIHFYQVLESMTQDNKIMVHYYNKQTKKSEPYISCPNFNDVSEAKEWVEQTHYPSALRKAGFKPVDQEALKPDAVERPLTLVEKLKNYRDTQTDFEATFADAVIDVCIDIVKQHSDWISVSEEIPVLEHECGFRSFEPTNFYQIIDNEGGLHNAYFSTNRYANDDRALFTLCELSLCNGKLVVDDEYEVITVDMVKFWKPLQLPNWAQEKIYEQEMDKIRFCGCGCILSDGLTQCSDCEALDG